MATRSSHGSQTSMASRTASLAWTATSLFAAALFAGAPAAAYAQLSHAGAPGAPLSVDHYVQVVSTAPSMEGQVAQIYVRERVLPGTALRSRSLEDRVIVHGNKTVVFD